MTTTIIVAAYAIIAALIFISNMNAVNYVRKQYNLTDHLHGHLLELYRMNMESVKQNIINSISIQKLVQTTAAEKDMYETCIQIQQTINQLNMNLEMYNRKIREFDKAHGK